MSAGGRPVGCHSKRNSSLLDLRIAIILEHLILQDTLLAVLANEKLSPVVTFDAEIPVKQVEQINPTHILIESDVPWCDRLLVDLLQLDNVIVIRLSLQHNQLQIYKRLDHNVRHASDLVSVLQGALA